MTRTEYLHFIDRNSRDALKTAKIHFAHGRALGAVTTNLFAAFGLFAERGLVEWRHSLASPVASFRSAVEVARQAAAAIPAAVAEAEALATNTQHANDKPSQHLRRGYSFFDFSFATLISLILDGKPDVDLLRAMPTPEDWALGIKKAESHIWIYFLDSGIVLTLLEDSTPVVWADILAFGLKSKRLMLAVAIYENYIKLIDAARAQDKPLVESLVTRSKVLYRQRKRDSYFSQGVSYLGGDGGDETVDLILALILKWYFGRNVREFEVVAGCDLWNW